MKRAHTRMRLVYWLIVIAGSLVLGLYMARTQWNSAVMGLWLLVIFLGAMGVELIWFRALARKTNALLPLLRTDPDRYMAELEALLGGLPYAGVRQTLRINQAAACCEKGDYDRAAELLTSLDPKRIPPVNQGAYWGDLALARFHLGQEQEARAIIDGQAALFAGMKTRPGLGGLAAVLSVYYALSQGDTALAWERFCAAREAWQDAATQRELDLLEERLRA